MPLWLGNILVWLAGLSPSIAKLFNCLMINKLVRSCRFRPHPMSTAHDYTSWTALTDRTWSARHLPPRKAGGLPGEEMIVDLFRRPPGRQDECLKSTCLFPAFAQYLTDGFIRTKMNHSDQDFTVRKRNDSNHQIDLCTLYGRTDEQTFALRLGSNSRGNLGKLKCQLINGEEYSPFLYDENDRFSDPLFAKLDTPLGIDKVKENRFERRLFATGGDRVNSVPQVAMINTLLLREHNRLAGEMERQNPDWDDERVFQTARISVIALFIKIVVEEYINHINPLPLRFIADPAVAWDAPWNQPNWITAEFSLLYRWHSLVPDVIRWNGQPMPIYQTFLNNNPLIQAGLVNAFGQISEQNAGRLGLFNTSPALMEFELKAIKQSRLYELDTYASYRHYSSLSKPTRWEHINPDPKVVNLLSKCYRTPGDVEFYVGLFAEPNNPNSPLPELLTTMVGVDAFSQALTNPALSRHVFNKNTFSSIGWDAIHNTRSLMDLIQRVSPNHTSLPHISMTRRDWTFH